ncbi:MULTISPECIES: hypothetical protein [Mycobacteriaceae]|uniref:hypothetical protein n=1 Tax=Mycobacteriaceae TaxID=1762 RepID=UPI0007FB78C5|nr:MULTISPECIES: hypothetical protein [Mycobacteriaceae]MCK0175483.1 hypothetical protein [Mycolicibacterium sp. F2034L]OBB59981.1 hypothetical protein A5757_13025 [Mycobacterium sp. 852013-51886_SCH5428379]
MAKRFEGRTRKMVLVGVGAFALSGATIGFGTGTAGADVQDIEPSPIVNGQTIVDGGNRASRIGVANAGPAEVRASRIGAPLPPAGGGVKDSQRAVPSITGGIGTYINMGPARNGPGMSGW